MGVFEYIGVLISVIMGLAIIGILRSNRKVHTALPIAWLILLGTYINLAAVGIIDT